MPTWGGRLARARHRTLRLVTGYGYQSWRAFIGLLLVLVLSVGVGVLAGHLRAARPTDPNLANARCPLIEQIGLGIDLGLPLIDSGIGDRCQFDTRSRWGPVLTGVGWLLQFAAWAMATLVIAGYTGLIRRIL